MTEDKYTIEHALELLEELQENWGVSAKAAETAKELILAHEKSPLTLEAYLKDWVCVNYRYGHHQCTVKIDSSGKIHSIESYRPSLEDACKFLDALKEIFG